MWGITPRGGGEEVNGWAINSVSVRQWRNTDLSAWISKNILQKESDCNFKYNVNSWIVLFSRTNIQIIDESCGIVNAEAEHLFTSTGNGGLDEWIQLLISSDGQLQVAGGDALHLQILRRVSCQLQDLTEKPGCHYSAEPGSLHLLDGKSTEARRYLGGEVFENRRAVHGGGGSHSAVAGGPRLEVSVDATHRELRATREGGFRAGGNKGLGGPPGRDGHQLSNLCSPR